MYGDAAFAPSRIKITSVRIAHTILMESQMISEIRFTVSKAVFLPGGLLLVVIYVNFRIFNFLKLILCKGKV